MPGGQRRAASRLLDALGHPQTVDESSLDLDLIPEAGIILEDFQRINDISEDGMNIVEDFKGFRTDLYVQRRKIMLDKYDIEILETN